MNDRGLTRGGLIKAGAAAALAAGAGAAGARMLVGTPVAELDSRPDRPSGGPAHLRHATYAPLVGTDFRVHVPGSRALKLRLVEARAQRGPGEAFSLLFQGRRRADMAGGLYRIEHPALGGFELFVNPVGRGVKGLHLEAVVNRIAI